MQTEIEANNEKKLKEVAILLGLDLNQAVYGSVPAVYRHYYNIASREVGTWPKIRFVDVPDWLAVKAKK